MDRKNAWSLTISIICFYVSAVYYEDKSLYFASLSVTSLYALITTLLLRMNALKKQDERILNEMQKKINNNNLGNYEKNKISQD